MPEEKQIRKALVGPGIITEGDFENAKKTAEKEDRSLESVLASQGILDKNEMGKYIADEIGYEFVNLSRYEIDSSVLETIPEVPARNQQAVVFEKNSNTLKVATSNPQNYNFFSLLERKTGREVKIFYTTPSHIHEILKNYKSNLQQKVQNLLDQLREDPSREQIIVELVNTFLHYAHDNNASDIHLEPLNESASVRFRIDGILHEVATYPKEIHQNVVYRIKIMSELETDEHNEPQDGRFTFDAEEERFDVRVSIIPVTSGENIVMRLLSEKSRRLSLGELGMDDKALERVKDAVQASSGMVLSVGPTGSGKTTTLYALLQILNTPEVNISTIENPVEYDIEHVQQTQVDKKAGITFANGLRSIVRQDPDIIMVGEIRDNETASIAVNSAMTGHLVLSTMHANDAATTFPRLMEMGVEPFLVTSGLNVVIAQRLVRTICSQCQLSHKLNEQDKKLLEKENELKEALLRVNSEESLSNIRVYKGSGKVEGNECVGCNGTGYMGRTALFEAMEVTEEIRKAVNEETSSDEIAEIARDQGMDSMFQDGAEKITRGITTIEEVIRVTKT